MIIKHIFSDPYSSFGRSVSIDLDELIDEIYMSPFTGRWFYESFAKTIEKVRPELENKIRYSQILDQ